MASKIGNSTQIAQSSSAKQAEKASNAGSGDATAGGVSAKKTNVLGKKKVMPKFMTKKEREAFDAQRKIEQQAKERLKRLERLY